MAQDATGLLIIRAWVEADSSQPLRARVSMTTDVSNGVEREQSMADIDDICGVVQRWLTAISTG